jgi:hypothetical protein
LREHSLPYSFADFAAGTRGGSLPIRRLRPLAESWVQSYFKSGSTLMPHYALDAVEFLEGMACGYYEGTWQTDPLVKDELNLDLFDASFKRDFTGRMATLVQATVPEGLSLWAHNGWSGKHTLFHAEEKFLFRVRRCHLSDAWGGETMHVHVEPEEVLPPYDVAERFELSGHVLSPGYGNQLTFSLPHHWITGEVVAADREGKALDVNTIHPLPTWELAPRSGQPRILQVTG